jgi:chitinase
MITLFAAASRAADEASSGWDAASRAADPTVQRVATPTFTPGPAAKFYGNVTVAIACATSGATICYTTDGSEPSASSAVYTAKLTFTKTTTLKAKAFKDGVPDSGILQVTYKVVPRAATPAFDQVSGKYLASVQVKISCATAGATIRYTTDGSKPSASSSAYKDPLILTKTTTLKARAFVDGIASSGMVKAVYKVIPRVATPTVSPGAGTVYVSAKVKLACATTGVTIRYTTDGSEPAATSPAYTTDLLLTATTTLKAKAFKDGLEESDLLDAAFEVLAQVAPPAFGSAAGKYYGLATVKLTCATAGATIRYTTDGNEPTANSAAYAAPVTLDKTATLKAKAFKDGLKDSDVMTAEYKIVP